MVPAPSPDARLSRRTFLLGAIAAAIAAPAVSASRQPGTHAPSPAYAVYDERYSAPRAFAAAAVRLGAVPVPTRGDCDRLWDELFATGAGRPTRRIAGLTTQADFEVLRSRASALGMRMIHAAIHNRRGSLTLTRTVVHSPGGAERFAELHPYGPDWAVALAHTLNHARFPHRARIADFAVPWTPGFPDQPGALASWLIT